MTFGSKFLRRTGPIHWRPLIVFLFLSIPSAVLEPGFAQQQSLSPSKPVGSEDEEKQVASGNTVIIMASGATSIFTRFAEDMRQTLDDRKEYTLRILPL